MAGPFIDTTLENGETARLRPMSPRDHERLREGIAALSPRSRYLRFFSGFEQTPEPILRRLSAIDGVNHIAWGAMTGAEPGGKAIGAAHAVRTGAPGEADFALGVLDVYHAQGVARMMIAALVQDCLAKGVWTFRADVLGENKKAISLFRALGAHAEDREGPVIKYKLSLRTADARLRAMPKPSGLGDVFGAFHEKHAA